MSQRVIIVPFFSTISDFPSRTWQEGNENEGDEMRRSIGNPRWEIAQNLVAAIGIADAYLHLGKVLLIVQFFFPHSRFSLHGHCPHWCRSWRNWLRACQVLESSHELDCSRGSPAGSQNSFPLWDASRGSRGLLQGWETQGSSPEKCLTYRVFFLTGAP